MESTIVEVAAMVCATIVVCLLAAEIRTFMEKKESVACTEKWRTSCDLSKLLDVLFRIEKALKPEAKP